MRALCCLLLLVLPNLLHSQHRLRTIEQLRRFEIGEAHCIAEEDELQPTSAVPLNVVFTLACNGKQLVRRDLGMADLEAIQISEDPSTVIVTVPSATGLTSGLFVVELAYIKAAAEARIIFDHAGEAGAESFESGQVLLVNFGRRFTGPVSLPEVTDVYRFVAGAYEFQASYSWKPDATWSDRYCILANSADYPATVKSRPTTSKLTYTRVVKRSELPAEMTQPRPIP